MAAIMSSVKVATIMSFLGMVASYPTMPSPRAAGAEECSSSTDDSRTLWPLTNWGGIGSKPDPALYKSEELYWGDGSKSDQGTGLSTQCVTNNH